jgi:hypothetical protein
VHFADDVELLLGLGVVLVAGSRISAIPSSFTALPVRMSRKSQSMITLKENMYGVTGRHVTPSMTCGVMARQMRAQ